MLQSNVAWYQLISFHPASCIAVCWRLDDPDPFPQGPPIPQGGAGYHCSIHILNLSYFPFVILFDLVFKIMILTFILVTFFSIHACLAWNQLSSSYFSIHQRSSSYPTSYSCWLEVGWPPPLPRAHPFHRGEGGLMGYDHDHGRGGGGGPGTWNIYIYMGWIEHDWVGDYPLIFDGDFGGLIGGPSSNCPIKVVFFGAQSFGSPMGRWCEWLNGVNRFSNLSRMIGALSFGDSSWKKFQVEY